MAVAAKADIENEMVLVLCCTHYGNVMASRVLVISLFINQIKNNTTVTITGLTMTHFLVQEDSVGWIKSIQENLVPGAMVEPI